MRDRGPILVLGGTGLLGESLRVALAEDGCDFDAPRSAELDLTDDAALRARLEARSYRAVIDAAAYTDVTRGEHPDERDRVFRLNRDTPRALARLCSERRARLLFVSTDFVFDGSSTRPYREDDPTRPIQVYGQSKLEGERAVTEQQPEAIIVRTSTLFGPGRRFRPHYVDAVLRQAARRERLEVVRPPVASPTYTPDLARAMLELLARDRPGTWHVVNAGGCSRLELARETVRLAGLDDRVEVVERPEETEGPRRPAYSVLDTTAFTRLTGRRLRSWDEALAEYLDRCAR